MELPSDAPNPRLCHLRKWTDFEGYGFNLHAEKSKSGQFIGKVDEGSPAQLAGLREGDRIVEVNGVNIANENHRQVVERIKSIANETKLLVIDEEGDKWYKDNKIIIKSSQLNVEYNMTPTQQPNNNMSNNEREDEVNGNDEPPLPMKDTPPPDPVAEVAIVTKPSADEIEVNATYINNNNNDEKQTVADVNPSPTAEVISSCYFTVVPIL